MRNSLINIYRHEEIAQYFNPNNAAILTRQLRIQPFFLNESHQSFLEQFLAISSNAQFTRLVVDCTYISLELLSKTIGLLPNLDSLSISSLLDIKSSSCQNRITKINLANILDYKQIHFILSLCPLVEYLQIDISKHIDLNELVRFILIQCLPYASRLCSLCLTISNAHEKHIDQLKNLIESEKLINNVQVKRINNHLLLKWN